MSARTQGVSASGRMIFDGQGAMRFMQGHPVCGDGGRPSKVFTQTRGGRTRRPMMLIGTQQELAFRLRMLNSVAIEFQFVRWAW